MVLFGMVANHLKNGGARLFDKTERGSVEVATK